MATLYITEFARLYSNPNGVCQTAYQPPTTADQTVSIGGSSTQSNAFNAATNIVRLHADSICSVEFGSNPTASTTCARMAANQTEYYAVVPGQKVAVISNV